jgi:microcystin-dependent protein
MSNGQKKHQLSLSEMPSHRHDIQLSKEGGNHSSSDNKEVGWDAANSGNYTNYAGGNQPHENRPPYYVLAFIMRVR